MAKIVIEIENCNQCPHLEKVYEWCMDCHADEVNDWICSKQDEKIQSCVSVYEESDVEIPHWCPILLEE